MQATIGRTIPNSGTNAMFVSLAGLMGWICFPNPRLLANVLLATLAISVAPFIQAAPNDGDRLVNLATLKYDATGVSLQADSEVVFRTLAGGTDAPPTAVTLQCQPPTPGETCTNGLIPENADGFVLGNLSVEDLDSTTHDLSVLDDIRFEIDQDVLRLADGETLDFEAGETTLDITIRAVDPSGLSVDQVITITIQDVNEPPFDLASNNDFVIPGSTERRIGLLTASDVDADEVQLFSVVDDDRFVILNDNILGLADGVVLDADTSIPVTVLVTDKGGLTTTTLINVTTTPPDPDPNGSSPTIEFMAPDATGNPIDVPEATCAPPSGILPDLGVQTSLRTNFVPGDVSGTQDLDTVDAYAIGDPVIVNVEDQQANLQPFAPDRVDVTLDITQTGDSEVLTLVETGPDTGVFVGFVFTTSQQSVINDCILTVASRTQVDASYTNRDGLQTVTTLAQISPVGILFNDETGEPISGVILALIDESTGEPADVRGDGPEFALFPSTVVTGETVTDAAGNVYENGPGEYRFPAIPDGTYRLVIFNDEGWNFSVKPDDQIQALGGQTSLTSTSEGQFILTQASRGAPFQVSQGSLPRIDIPVDQLEPPAVVEPSPSEIQFLQFSANPNFGNPVDVGQTTCVAGVNSQAVELKDVDVPVPGVVNLAPATVFKVGQPIFVQVTDPDQNFASDERENITIELAVPASDDREFIRLTETGTDTGIFVGYIQSTGEAQTVSSNCSLGVVQNETIRTIYNDIFDETDVSDALALVDPFGRVFSAKDGRLINGVAITLIDTATGAPAAVFGDGPQFAAFPSTITTGGQAVDEAGVVYDFPEGEYRFPFVAPGFYELRIDDVPGGLIFPSATPNETIQSLSGAPYQVVVGSRGEEFEVPVGPAINIDIPLDEPLGETFVSKQASKQVVSIGEFIQYQINVQNLAGAAIPDVQIRDFLPKGFRYQRGSLKINGEEVADPNLLPDGRTMLIDINSLTAADTAVTYVAEVTPGAEVGQARNEATITGDLIVSSNTAFANVIVTNDLFNEKAFLVGRVTYEECLAEGAAEVASADEEVEAQGIPGVRIYLEDGSFVITDDQGFWHMEGIEPGVHVVQMDTDSLEARYEPSPCNDNTRFAGSPYSQFVDLQGGTLWRTDFKVQDRDPPESDITLSQTLKVDNEGIWVELRIDNEGQVQINNTNLIYNVPKEWKIVDGSEVLDGLETGHQQSIVGAVYDIGSVSNTRKLRFKIEPKNVQRIEMVEDVDNLVVEFDAQFKTRSTELSDADRAELDRLIELWVVKDWAQITVVGHTDNVPIAPRNQKEFKDNEALSEARAAAVAEYVSNRVKVDDLVVVGAADQYPIASNATREGRAKNRRIEFLLKPKPEVTERQVVSASALNGESRVRMRFNSAGTKKGAIDTISMQLNKLVGGFEKLTATSQGTAKGTWDYQTANDNNELVLRDPNLQGFINIFDGDRLGVAVKAVKLDLDSRLTPKLTLDGQEISEERIGFRSADDSTGKTIYSYIGVDFGDPGRHTLTLQGMDPFGNARFTESIEIIRAGELERIRLISSGDNVADGSTPVTVNLDLLDKFGEVVGVPYRVRLKNSSLQAYTADLSLTELSQLTDANYVDITAEGVLSFAPVSVSGNYRFTLSYNEFEREFEVFVAPEKRDWILVGLIEGTAAYNSVSGNLQNLQDAGIEDELTTDGSVAFYAKGQIKGEFILTIAYDSDKPETNSLQQIIDPNSFYTLYGDRTATQYDAASGENLFLKLERDEFYALYGDFTTGLDGGELSSYSRSFTGLKSEYNGDNYDVVVYAAETDQGFVKDEIRGDGTSGLYRLRGKDIVVNSEQITIQTRDRFQSQEIINELNLTRFIDYNIDYNVGTIFFKQPIFSQDEAFNPIFIVVDYEVAGDGANEINAGGRIAYNPQEGMEMGLTLIREGVQGRESDLVGLDFEYEINDQTSVRAEVASTRTEVEGETTDGTAYILEATHRDEGLEATAYIREQQGNFGLGQQNASEIGTRKIGANARYRISDSIEVAGEIYRDSDLVTGTDQDVVSSTVQMIGDRYSVSTGLRSAMTTTADGEDRMSNQFLLGGSYKVLDGKLVLNANLDTPIANKGDVGDFPKRLRVGLDYKVSEKITINAEQEFSWGEEQDTQGTRIGLSSDLWQGGQLVTSVEQSQDGENSGRLAAVAGLKQRWDLNENWSFDFGVDRSQTIKENRSAPPELTVTTVFSSPSNDDFTAVTFGSKFRKDAWDWSTRVEYRNADSGDRINLVSDVIHNLDDGQTMLAKFDVQTSETRDSDTTLAGLQLGYSYRPVDSRWTIFNRLDLNHNRVNGLGSDTTSQKIVNNLNANYVYSDKTQIALQYGAKYVVDNFDSDEYRGFTDLYGMEVRHDLNSRWDVGFQGSFYNSRNADVSDYSYGVSFGYTMARNVWVSLGYNFDGFEDDDFSAAEYTAEGIFLKYRMKFDQNTASSILGLMNQ